MRYRVHYEGFFITEANSIQEAMNNDRDDAIYEEWQTTGGEKIEKDEV